MVQKTLAAPRFLLLLEESSPCFLFLSKSDYILTLDEDPDADYNGIKRINALQWMMALKEKFFCEHLHISIINRNIAPDFRAVL